MPDINVLDDLITISEFNSQTVSNAVDVYDSLSVAEYFDRIDGLYFIFHYESFVVSEDFVIEIPMVLILIEPVIGVTDELPGPSVSINRAFSIFSSCIVNENLSIARTPELLFVFEPITVNEFRILGFEIFNLPLLFETITISEIAFKQTVADTAFSQFDRSYPFEEETLFNVITQVYESGAEQRRDKWGRSKKLFSIQFAPRSKAEIDAIKDFYVENSGPATLFNFINPLDSITYTVKFASNSLKIQRIAYGVYQASVQLEQVFQ